MYRTDMPWPAQGSQIKMVILKYEPQPLPSGGGLIFEACQNDISDDGIPSFKPHFSSPNLSETLPYGGRELTSPRARGTGKEAQRIDAVITIFR